jgi:NADH-quinone oxidoreductase subunit J
VASLTACVLLGAIFYTLGEWRTQASGGETTGRTDEVSEISDGLERSRRFLVVPGGNMQANALSRPEADEYGTLQGLGRSLFGDYLFAVELAGTLLLVASIGAILIAPKRTQEAR